MKKSGMNAQQPGVIARHVAVLVVLVAMLMATACAPSVSMMQDASTIEQGDYRITPYLGGGPAIVTESDRGTEGDFEIQGEVGAHVRWGLADRLELQTSFQIQAVSAVPVAASGSVGLKLEAIEDHLALYVPLYLGLMSGADNGFIPLNASVNPTLIGSIDLAKTHQGPVKLNPFVRAIIPLTPGVDYDTSDVRIYPAAGVSLDLPIERDSKLILELTAVGYDSIDTLDALSIFLPWSEEESNRDTFPVSRAHLAFNVGWQWL